MSERFVMVVDRPFFCTIRDNETGVRRDAVGAASETGGHLCTNVLDC